MSDAEHRPRSAWPLIAGFAVLAVLIAAAGYWAWLQQSRSMQHQAERSLVAIGELKTGQITSWLDERHADAELLHTDPLLSTATADLLAGRRAAAASADLQTFLDAFRRSYGYVEVVMTTPGGAVLLRSPQAATQPLGAPTRALVAKATATGAVQSSDLYLDAAAGARMDFVAPILGPRGSGPVIAAVTLRRDPSLFLYPLIQHWPLPSKSGETLLVERRGDQVVFLNELRHRKNTAFKLTLPLSRTEVPAVMAVRGRRGIAQGVDYRGVPVLAAVQPVPGTPWFIVAKEDTGEVLGAIRTRGWLTAGFTLLLVLLAGAGTLFFWRSRQAQAALAIRESEQKYRMLIENLSSGVVVHAPDTRILLSNPRAGELLGLSTDQMQGKTAMDPHWRFLSDDAEPLPLERYPVSQVLASGEALTEFVVGVCRSERAAPLWLLCNGYPERDEHGELVQIVITFADITERKRAEEALKRNGAMIEAVKLAQDRFLSAEDPFESFDSLLVELLGLTGSEYGFIDELVYNADGQPELTAWAITNIAWNDETRALYPGFLNGELRFTNLKSLWGTVITTGKPVIANDPPHDPRRSRIPPGHPALNAFLGMPLRAGGELVGVIGLANAPGGYSEQTATFLEPMVKGCANLIAALRGDQRRRRAEEAMLKSQDLLTQAEKLGRVGGWEFDIETQLQTWTETVYDIHEVDFTSQPTVDQGEDFYTPASRPIIERAVQRAIEQGEPFDVELEIITAKGNLRSVHAVGKADLARGKVAGFIQDITERKHAEEELRASERKFRETIQALDEGYYSVTLDGVLLDHNPAFNTILGIDPAADLHGRDMPDFWWDRSDRTAYVEQLSRDGIIRDYLVRAKRADGSPLIVLASAHLVRDERTEVARIDGSIVDFTARHAAEDEVARLNTELEQRVLERTARLDAANEELEAFAYSVSHDLRAPLRHISGFSELLAARSGDVLDDSGRHYLETITTSVHQMGVLIDDLLQFSRTGRAELKIEPVDMDATLAEALEPLRRETADRDIEWTIGRLPAVIGDHALLRQVWANLLSNAVKYSRGRTPARIEVGARDGDGAGEDVFWVRDNGVGFDMQYAHKLFGVFQRLHSTAEFEGTGIGLANVKRIVNRLGGRVWAEGEVDHGATFYFSLPRRKETPS